MKAEKYREMTVEELRAESLALSEQLFKLRLQNATGQLENHSRIRHIRKDLARVKTVIGEVNKASSSDDSLRIEG